MPSIASSFFLFDHNVHVEFAGDGAPPGTGSLSAGATGGAGAGASGSTSTSPRVAAPSAGSFTRVASTPKYFGNPLGNPAGAAPAGAVARVGSKRSASGASPLSPAAAPASLITRLASKSKDALAAAALSSATSHDGTGSVTRTASKPQGLDSASSAAASARVVTRIESKPRGDPQAIARGAAVPAVAGASAAGAGASPATAVADADVPVPALSAEACKDMLAQLGKADASVEALSAACAATQAAAESEANRELLAREGAIPVLLAVLRRHAAVASVVQAALSALAHLARSSVVKTLLASEAEGAVLLVLELLTRHSGSAGVTAQAARLLGNTATEEATGVAVAKAGVVPALASALRAHEESALAVEMCVYALYALTLFGGESLEELTRHEAAGLAIVSALRRHEASEAIVREALHTLAAFAAVEPNKASLASSGAVQLVVAAARRHEANASVVAESLSALCNLAAVSHDTQLQLAREGAIAVVCAALRRHDRVGLVVEHCLAALANLVSGAYKEVEEPLTKDEALPLIIAAMHRHEDHAGVVRRGLGALVNLAACADGAKRLMQLNALPIIVAALRRHPDDAGVVDRGLGALCNLGLADVGAEPALVRADVVPVIAQALHKHGSCTKLVFSGLLLLSLIAGPDEGAALIVRDGAVQSIIAAMRRHEDDSDIIQYSMRTLAFVAMDDNDYKSVLAREGSVAVIVAALQRHAEVEGVVRRGLLALKCLASDADIQTLIVREGARDVVLAAVRRHDAVAQLVVEGIGCLVYLLRDDDSRQALILKGLIPTLVAAVRQHEGDEMLVEYALTGLHFLAASSAETAELLVRDGAVQAVIAALLRHAAACDAATLALETLHNLCVRNDCARAALLVREGAIPAIVSAMRQQEDNAEVILAAVSLLDVFAQKASTGNSASPESASESDSDRNTVLQGMREGAVTALSCALHRHADHDGVKCFALQALHALRPSTAVTGSSAHGGAGAAGGAGSSATPAGMARGLGRDLAYLTRPPFTALRTEAWTVFTVTSALPPNLRSLGKGVSMEYAEQLFVTVAAPDASDAASGPSTAGSASGSSSSSGSASVPTILVFVEALDAEDQPLRKPLSAGERLLLCAAETHVPPGSSSLQRFIDMGVSPKTAATGSEAAAAAGIRADSAPPEAVTAWVTPPDAGDEDEAEITLAIASVKLTPVATACATSESGGTGRRTVSYVISLASCPIPIIVRARFTIITNLELLPPTTSCAAVELSPPVCVQQPWHVAVSTAVAGSYNRLKAYAHLCMPTMSSSHVRSDICHAVAQTYSDGTAPSGFLTNVFLLPSSLLRCNCRPRPRCLTPAADSCPSRMPTSLRSRQAPGMSICTTTAGPRARWATRASC